MGLAVCVAAYRLVQVLMAEANDGLGGHSASAQHVVEEVFADTAFRVRDGLTVKIVEGFDQTTLDDRFVGPGGFANERGDPAHLGTTPQGVTVNRRQKHVEAA